VMGRPVLAEAGQATSWATKSGTGDSVTFIGPGLAVVLFVSAPGSAT
jgi:NADPH-dependent ferric siderophore reductase